MSIKSKEGEKIEKAWAIVFSKNNKISWEFSYPSDCVVLNVFPTRNDARLRLRDWTKGAKFIYKIVRCNINLL